MNLKSKQAHISVLAAETSRSHRRGAMVMTFPPPSNGQIEPMHHEPGVKSGRAMPKAFVTFSSISSSPGIQSMNQFVMVVPQAKSPSCNPPCKNLVEEDLLEVRIELDELRDGEVPHIGVLNAAGEDEYPYEEFLGLFTYFLDAGRKSPPPLGR